MEVDAVLPSPSEDDEATQLPAHETEEAAAPDLNLVQQSGRHSERDQLARKLKGLTRQSADLGAVGPSNSSRRNSGKKKQMVHTEHLLENIGLGMAKNEPSNVPQN